jgi:hypothetical protein
MIVNIQSMPFVYKCNKRMAHYLQYEKHLPLLSVDEKYYYFVHNEELDKILESVPLMIKILNLIK